MSGLPAEMVQRAAQSKSAGARYTGDVTPADAWSILSSCKAVLLDVRTEPEWRFSGTARLDDTPSQVAYVSWVSYPDYQMNSNFLAQCRAEVPHKDVPVLVLCKIGGRSHHAGNALADAGYVDVFNILTGFEGEHDVKQQRGQVNGWKAEGLPWIQS